MAWILVIFGAFKIVTGFFVALNFESEQQMIAASKRYLAASSSGEAIDKGFIYLAIGILVGLLVEIAKKRNVL